MFANILYITKISFSNFLWLNTIYFLIADVSESFQNVFFSQLIFFDNRCSISVFVCKTCKITLWAKKSTIYFCRHFAHVPKYHKFSEKFHRLFGTTGLHRFFFLTEFLFNTVCKNVETVPKNKLFFKI